MTKKIGFIGTNSAGKTTLCHQTVALLKKAGVDCDAVTRQDRHFSFDRKQLETDRLAQWSLLCTQMKAEADMCLTGAEMVITDRSPFDIYAYYVNTKGGEDILDTLIEDWCATTFEMLYLLRPVTYEAVPTRPPTEAFRNSVHQTLLIRAHDYMSRHNNMTIEPAVYEEGMIWRKHLPKQILAMSGKVRKVTNAIRAAIRDVFPCPVLIGGSYAKGLAGVHSDLDLFVLKGTIEVSPVQRILDVPVELHFVPDQGTWKYLKSNQGFIEV